MEPSCTTKALLAFLLGCNLLFPASCFTQRGNLVVTPESRLVTGRRRSFHGCPSMKQNIDDECDIVVIGAGIGGLCCAGLLAKEGYSVQVFESHTIPGGCAHSFVREGFHFDSGPTIYAGFSREPSNPLKTVLDRLGEDVPMIEYDGWGMLTPEGPFKFTMGPAPFRAELRRRAADPERALAEFDRLLARSQELHGAAMGLPASALRADGWAALPLLKYLPQLLRAAGEARTLQGPFTDVMAEVGVTDKFLTDWLNALAFSLSGLEADGTMGAAMAYTLADLHREGACLDYPRGGGGKLIEALVRGVEKHGGKLHLGKHVEEILVEGGRAAGVRLRSGGRNVRARRAVVSNAPVWNTVDLFPPGALPADVATAAKDIPKTESYLHLHLGIDGTGLDTSGLHPHYTVINSWEGIADPLNMMAISFPTLLDPSLAPEGCHVIHAYCAGNEPYGIWAEHPRGSPEYERLKQERGEALWRAVERIVPDVRQRAKVALVGSPVTHARFLRRADGTYGPVFDLQTQKFPQPDVIPMEGFLCCGDSISPGIGVPAVAVSGMNAAHTLMPVWRHLALA